MPNGSWIAVLAFALAACAGYPSAVADSKPTTMSARPGFEQTTAFTSGTHGYHTYRIPSAVVTTKGTLLVFCEGRVASGSDTGKIDLLVKRSTDGGRTFSPQQVVWSDGENTCGNPCAVVDETTGTVWLLMTHNLGADREKDIIAGTSKGDRTVWVTSSDDDGVTWAKPHEITKDVKRDDWEWYATGPGNGIQLKRGPHKGRLVIPCDHVVRGGGPATPESGRSHLVYSDDHGQTWRLGGQPPGGGFNECQLVELSDGRLMLNMRNYLPRDADRKLFRRGVAISADGGETFSETIRDEKLIEPICQASVVRLTWPDEGGKSRVLFSNPASTDERVAMTVRLSYDEGKTWPVERLVFKGWSVYSNLVPLPDGTIGLLYESGDRERHERIDFARFSLEWLTRGKDRHPSQSSEPTP